MKKSIKELQSLSLKILSSKYSAEHAQLIADSLLYSQMSERETHGFVRLLKKRFGPMDEFPEGEIEVHNVSPNISRISSKGYPGYLLSELATKETLKNVKTSGMAMTAFVGNKSTSGYLSKYLREIADNGYVGIMLSNCAPFVSPAGGKKRLLGTNPIGFSIPSADSPSLVVDFGTSKISFGEAAMAAEKGIPLTENGAQDSQGNFTQNPSELFHGGSLLPFGEHKGFALSLIIEMICGPMLGASPSGIDPEKGWGNLQIAFDPTLLGGSLEDSSTLIKHFLSDESTVESFRLPGFQSYERYLSSKKEGMLNIDESIFTQIQTLANSIAE
ncbi:Ldh family oxidoreductase [bacterium]|nr:Ldh family oxidoreductase [bacterium]